jgi:hypothetical protein
MNEKTKTLNEQIADIDATNKLLEFAETVLGCDDKRADQIARTMKHKFTWSGVRLLWNGDAGDQPIVAVDHVDQIKEYFAREKLDFLLPVPAAVDIEGFAESIPGDVLEAALNGSKTAEGKICMLLGGSNKDAAARTALLLKTERALREKGAVNGDVNLHGTTNNERRTTSTNPFSRLRTREGAIDKKVESQIASMIVAMGAGRVAGIAKACVSPDAPFGRSITGLALSR